MFSKLIKVPNNNIVYSLDSIVFMITQISLKLYGEFVLVTSTQLVVVLLLVVVVYIKNYSPYNSNTNFIFWYTLSTNSSFSSCSDIIVAILYNGCHVDTFISQQYTRVQINIFNKLIFN